MKRNFEKRERKSETMKSLVTRREREGEEGEEQ